MDYDFPETVGIFFFPTDELSPSFFRWVGQPPTRFQWWMFHFHGSLPEGMGDFPGSLPGGSIDAVTPIDLIALDFKAC